MCLLLLLRGGFSELGKTFALPTAKTSPPAVSIVERKSQKKKIKQNSQCNLLSSFINFLNCKKVCVFLGRCLPCRARLWTHLVTHTFENFSYSPVISVCYTRPKGGLTWSVPGVCKPKEKH